MSEHTSDNIWADFDATGLARQQDNFKQAGITDEIWQRLKIRGIVIKSVMIDSPAEGGEMHMQFDALPGTPAHKMWVAYTGTYEEKIEELNRYVKDAFLDADEDHFRAQWPEAF